MKDDIDRVGSVDPDLRLSFQQRSGRALVVVVEADPKTAKNAANHDGHEGEPGPCFHSCALRKADNDE